MSTSLATHDLWAALPAAQANDILLAVQKNSKKLYRTAVEVMAPRMGVRVPILLEMPKSERHAHWARILSRPEMEVLSFNLLSTWLIETHAPLLCAWLDSLGIAHNAKGCADHFPPAPDAAKLRAGIDVLLKDFDPSLIAIYLRCFNQIDETNWPALDEILRTDARLALKAEAAAGA
jgi:hypothetical protein